jgi:Flp pilus assembly protein TadD
MAARRTALIRPAALALWALLLAACSLPPPYRVPSPPAAVPPAGGVAAPEAPPGVAPPGTEPPPAAPPPTREYRLGAATQSLVVQAHAQVARGELPGASTTLDRALRIEPQNPLLWIEVARLRLAEGDARQAEACARKAQSLSSGDPVARSQSGHVLADALRAQRRNQEAHAVESDSAAR